MGQRHRPLENMVTFGQTYQGKRVLVTGHTGFKGGWLCLWLHSLGAKVSGFSLAPPAGDTLFAMLPKDLFAASTIGDLRDVNALETAVAQSQADIIFHLAAQPIVGASYRDPMGTFTTNAIGTANLLEAARKAKSKAALVIVTSDKCYRNDNSGRAFIETDPLGGHDVYSMSKAATELVVAAWHASFGQELGPIATGRAGNVIGGGDYGEDRIVPDAVRAFEAQQPMMLRRPAATRPWQHVLESVSGYLTLGQRLLTKHDTPTLLNYNFGPDCEAERSVQELMEAWLIGWPNAFALEVAPLPAYAEATRLSLDHNKAKHELGWQPVWDFATTVARTVEWYRRRHEAQKDSAAMLALTLNQIHDYTADALLTGSTWAN
jgi:CDP-glucose 4,6-dehydratase